MEYFNNILIYVYIILAFMDIELDEELLEITSHKSSFRYMKVITNIILGTTHLCMTYYHCYVLHVCITIGT